MRKFILMLAAIAAITSCVKAGPDMTSGTVAGEINVTAAAGSITISVETVGRWVVYEADNADWVEFDVRGGVGKGAFTVKYESNLSSVTDLKDARKAKIVVTSEEYAKSDTLNIVQQGFENAIVPSVPDPSKEIVFEYVESEVRTVTVVYCSADGVADMAKLKEWAGQFDVVACGNSFLKPEVAESAEYAKCEFDDMNLVSADFSEEWTAGQADELRAFRDMVENTYNAYDSPAKWIVGGQMYHYSMMQSSYLSTPSWYPSDIEEPVFDADRYAWNNNLYDCLWMAERDFVETWITSDGKGYMADYIYVSRDVLATVYSVEKLDKVLGMTHNPVKLTLKY